jgi:hypothetical protein
MPNLGTELDHERRPGRFPFPRESLQEVLTQEIAALERTKNALPSDSHARALCDLAMERLRVCIEIVGSSEAAYG